MLKRTLRELATLGDHAESINSRELAHIVLGDPLMTMRLLSWLQKHRRRSQNRDITTIDRAIMMLGVDPFINSFSNAHTLEEQLGEHPKTLLGALHTINRARRSAAYARDWAIIRRDANPDEVTVATLLHEATEIMLRIFAPTLMQRVDNMMQADPRLPQHIAIKAVFNAPVDAIQRELARLWQLPELLVDMLNPANRETPRVRNVELALRFTRHLQTGWSHPSIRADLENLCRLLPLNAETILKRMEVPADIASRLLGPPDKDSL